MVSWKEHKESQLQMLKDLGVWKTEVAFKVMQEDDRKWALGRLKQLEKELIEVHQRFKFANKNGDEILQFKLTGQTGLIEGKIEVFKELVGGAEK